MTSYCLWFYFFTVNFIPLRALFNDNSSRKTISNSKFGNIQSITKEVFYSQATLPPLPVRVSAFLVSLLWNITPKTMRKPQRNQAGWHSGALSATGRLKVLNILCFAFLNISLILMSHLCAPKRILAAEYDLILSSPLWRPSTLVRNSSLYFFRKPSVQETIKRFLRLMTKGKKTTVCTKLNLSSESFSHTEMMKLQE